jgi:hypothetical protein
MWLLTEYTAVYLNANFRLASEHRTIVQINAFYHRLYLLSYDSDQESRNSQILLSLILIKCMKNVSYCNQRRMWQF